MSYFSREAINKYYKDDCSYPSPEMQLRWRLEELKARYEELVEADFAYKNPLILMEDDLRYALPEDLHSIRHIKSAIELAEFELRDKYGIITVEKQEEKSVILFVLPQNIYQHALIS